MKPALRSPNARTSAIVQNMLNSNRQKLLTAALLAVLLAGLAAIQLSDQPGGPVATATPVPDNAVWIDVRSPGEYAQGHLQQAPRISHNEIEAGVAKLGLARDTPIYLYCAVGGRAGKAKQRLEAQGYTNVTNVGGLEDARRLAGNTAQ